jgi:hypothetical protein
MSDSMHSNIVEVSCTRRSNNYPCGYVMRYIISVNEYDSEVEVRSATKIEGFERGWVGDLKFKTDGVLDIGLEGYKKIENPNPVHCIKDVVLKQIKINNDGKDYGTDFTYVFLKF